jgi:hypothetical protein
MDDVHRYRIILLAVFASTATRGSRKALWIL